jgi:hypothetical protein
MISYALFGNTSTWGLRIAETRVVTVPLLYAQRAQLQEIVDLLVGFKLLGTNEGGSPTPK